MSASRSGQCSESEVRLICSSLLSELRIQKDAGIYNSGSSAEPLARTRLIQSYIVRDAAVFNDQHATAQDYRAGNIVRDWNCRKTWSCRTRSKRCCIEVPGSVNRFSTHPIRPVTRQIAETIAHEPIGASRLPPRPVPA
jgi:hypothetical protein